MVIDFRRLCSNVTTVSDASEAGAGVCQAKCLTLVGRKALISRLSLPETGRSGRLCLAAIFGGISGARVALQRLNITPHLHFSIEAAIRVTQRNFPDCVHLGDVREVGVSSFLPHASQGKRN